LALTLLKVARLGGYLARASDPPIRRSAARQYRKWRGLSRLTDVALGAIVGGELVGN
jgi:hypothetical protein